MVRATLFGLVLAFTCGIYQTTDAALYASSKRCGTTVCDLLQYCSSFHNQCESCQTICQTESHNFDQELCASQCQDFLFEQRFAKATHYAADIQRLQKQQTLMLIILIVLLILFLLIHGTHCIRWMRHKDYISFGCMRQWRAKSNGKLEKPTPEQMTHANPHTQSPKLRPHIQRNNTHDTYAGGNGDIKSVYSISGQEGSVHTVSTPISRHPAEDSTLDFTYDNAALQVTPTSGEKPKTETTF